MDLATHRRAISVKVEFNGELQQGKPIAFTIDDVSPPHPLEIKELSENTTSSEKSQGLAENISSPKSKISIAWMFLYQAIRSSSLTI